MLKIEEERKETDETIHRFLSEFGYIGGKLGKVRIK